MTSPYKTQNFLKDLDRYNFFVTSISCILDEFLVYKWTRWNIRSYKDSKALLDSKNQTKGFKSFLITQTKTHTKFPTKAFQNHEIIHQRKQATLPSY